MPQDTPSSPVQIQERDVAILRGLFESRVMTLRHASSLFFEGRDEAAKKRMQKLKAAGLVAERPRSPFEPAVLHLTRRGLLQLRERGILQEYPEFGLPSLERRAKVSPLTLPHELEVMDVKAAIYAAVAEDSRLTVAEFTTWPLLNQFEAGGKIVKPDGFLRVRERDEDGVLFEHCFFVEVDRSTEAQGVLAERAAAYRAYYQTGGFAERMGGEAADVRRFPFRLLFILKSEERRNNLAESLTAMSPPILSQVWLTTARELIAAPLGQIWARPAEYRRLMEETPSAAKSRRLSEVYRRRTARDKIIREGLPLLRLLE